MNRFKVAKCINYFRRISDMKRKVVAAVLTMAMAGSLLAGCGSSSSDDSSSKSETTTTDESGSSDSEASAREDFSGVSITMLNTKSEIESQLEAAAEQWGELTGAKLEVYTIGSGTPSQEVSARYAAKNAPTGRCFYLRRKRRRSE